MDKKDLEKLIKLVSEIAETPGNNWFKDDLYKAIYSKAKNNPVLKVDLSKIEDLGTSPIVGKIDLIRNYLSIDVQNLIDYNGFEEPAREQLFRDCLEMCRFEKGTPNHKKNFGEFCRYAHLQAEELINYFFHKISNGDINSLNDFFKRKNSRYNPQKSPTSIFHIPYTVKLFVFKELIEIEKDKLDNLFFLNEFRNELSHRNSWSANQEDVVLSKFEKMGFVDTYIDYSSLTKDQSIILNKGKYIRKKRMENYFLVFETLENLKNSVFGALKVENLDSYLK